LDWFENDRWACRGLINFDCSSQHANHDQKENPAGDRQRDFAVKKVELNGMGGIRWANVRENGNDDDDSNRTPPGYSTALAQSDC
jgi:hypothetical protein